MSEIEKIILYRDELEALKLCDLDGLTQEEAGKRMRISRGTVQRILASARKKVASALSECKALVCEKTISKAEV
jgi:RNA polymerase sigma factor (sigma-70 family)